MSVKRSASLTISGLSNLFILRTKLCIEFPLLRETFDTEQTYKKNIQNHGQVCFTHSLLNALGYVLFRRETKYFTNKIWKALYLSKYRLVKYISHPYSEQQNYTHRASELGYHPSDFCNFFFCSKSRNHRWKPGYVFGISFSIYSLLSLSCYSD